MFARLKDWYKKIKKKVRVYLGTRKGELILNNVVNVLPLSKEPDLVNDDPGSPLIIQRIYIWVRDDILSLGLDCYTDKVDISYLIGSRQRLAHLTKEDYVKRLVVRFRNAFSSFNSNKKHVIIMSYAEAEQFNTTLKAFLSAIIDSNNGNYNKPLEEIFDELGTWFISEINRRRISVIQNKGKRWLKPVFFYNYRINEVPVASENVNLRKQVPLPPGLSKPTETPPEPQWFDSIVKSAIDDFNEYNKSYPQIVKNGILYIRLGKNNISKVFKDHIAFKIEGYNEFSFSNGALAEAGANVDNIHMFYVALAGTGVKTRPSGIYHFRRIHEVPN